MKIYRQLDEIVELKNPVVTIGTFDGVHIGHRKILESLIKSAQEINGLSMVMTFDPHPRHVLQPNRKVTLLTLLEEKIELLKNVGIDAIFIQHFDLNFSSLTSNEFVENILVKGLGVKKLVIGYDHHFGKNRNGSLADLQMLGKINGFEVEEIPAQDVDHVVVSSTKIRNAIEEGAVEKANEFLGYAYAITSKVIEGRKLGRTIGFPTANLALPTEMKLIPLSGVYAVKVTAEHNTYKGMLNIGFKPTIAENQVLSAEVHILDFNQQIYGKTIKIEFIRRIRSEMKFENFDKLAEQLQEDKRTVSNILKF